MQEAVSLRCCCIDPLKVYERMRVQPHGCDMRIAYGCVREGLHLKSCACGAEELVTMRTPSRRIRDKSLVPA